MTEKIQQKILKKSAHVGKSKESALSPSDKRSNSINKFGKSTLENSAPRGAQQKLSKIKTSLNTSESSSYSQNKLSLLGNYKDVSKALENTYQKVIANPIEDPE